MNVCRSAEAYEAVIEYMQEEYAGYQADFVFNPDNRLLTDLLIRKGAAFDPVQVRMVFSGNCPAIDTEGVEVLSERYHEQYLAMHTRDVFWTGDKVIEADKFRVFIGVENGSVAGYLDVTCKMGENEVYNLQVKDPARETEWSRRTCRINQAEGPGKGTGDEPAQWNDSAGERRYRGGEPVRIRWF